MSCLNLAATTAATTATTTTTTTTTATTTPKTKQPNNQTTKQPNNQNKQTNQLTTKQANYQTHKPRNKQKKERKKERKRTKQTKQKNKTIRRRRRRKRATTKLYIAITAMQQQSPFLSRLSMRCVCRSCTSCPFRPLIDHTKKIRDAWRANTQNSFVCWPEKLGNLDFPRRGQKFERRGEWGQSFRFLSEFKRGCAQAHRKLAEQKPWGQFLNGN